MLASSRYRTRSCSQPCCHVNAGVSVPDPLEARRGVGGRRSTDGEARPARIGSVGVAWARASSVVRRDVLSPGVADTSLAASDGRGCARIQPEAAGVMTRRVAWRVEANEASGCGRLGAPRAASARRIRVRWPPFRASFILPRCYAYYASCPTRPRCFLRIPRARARQRKHMPPPNPMFPPKFQTHVLIRTTHPILWVDRVHGAPAPRRTAPSTLRLLLYVIQRWATWSLLFT